MPDSGLPRDTSGARDAAKRVAAAECNDPVSHCPLGRTFYSSCLTPQRLRIETEESAYRNVRSNRIGTSVHRPTGEHCGRSVWIEPRFRRQLEVTPFCGVNFRVAGDKPSRSSMVELGASKTSLYISISHQILETIHRPDRVRATGFMQRVMLKQASV